MRAYNKDNSWRSFQSEYIGKKKKKALLFRILRLTTVLTTLLLLIFGAVLYTTRISKDRTAHRQAQEGKTVEVTKPLPKIVSLSKTELSDIMKQTKFFLTDKNVFFLDTPEYSFKITTSIDTKLQKHLLSRTRRLKQLTRGKPERIALVAMEADTGKIIAMTGFDLANPDSNPCIESDYPAASIFKIITAAAAVESLGYNQHTPQYFNGNKYTLYKSQLSGEKNKYTLKTSFSNAFAQSINPVFGKIGKNYLGKKKLEAYADKFRFNQLIQSDLPFITGQFKTNDKAYHLAELGCGFNTDTTISPLFGAMLTSAIINSGKMMTPSIVDHVTNTDGKIIYKREKSAYNVAIKPKTATTMIQLMEKTITKGTARKTFKGVSKDKVLSKLIIGGKTGSLFNKKRTIKYDWFTGFGKLKGHDKKIALSVVVGHGKYIGTKASAHAKSILKQYFKEH